MSEKIEGFDEYQSNKHASPSSFCKLERCPRMFFYHYGIGLREKEHILAFDFGTGIHYGLPFAHRQDVDGALSAFKSIWGEQDELGDKKRNSFRARAMLEDFSKHHRGSTLYKIIQPVKQEGVQAREEISEDEINFAIDVGIRNPVVGRIDAFGFREDFGDYCPVEYKTSSRLSVDFLAGFALTPQVLTYVLALKMLSDKEINGGIIEGLCVAIKKVETLGMFLRVSNQSIEDIVGWYQRLDKTLERYENSGDFPKNLSMCTPYSGFGVHGWVCPFQPMCQREDWRSLRSLYFKEEPKEFLV